MENMTKFIQVMLIFLFLAAHCQAGEILSIEEGLTLAQTESKGVINIIAVTADDGERIEGVNISELSGIDGDIPSLYNNLGYQKIKELVLANRDLKSSIYSYSELLSPAGDESHHIGLGFNYTDHAEEVEADRLPFLFLKTTTATRQHSIVSGEGRLLDYEIEVCARPLTAIRDDRGKNIPFGFFICGDFTDRATLLRNINVDNMQSGEGFSVAKSRIGYFPTGPYLVLPRDRDTFLSRVSISLYRNGELKQHGEPTDMVWPLDTIVQNFFHAHHVNLPTHTDSSSTWMHGEEITPNMVFLTGTPEGVIMRPPSRVYKILRGIQYCLSGAFFTTTPRSYVIDKYISDLIEEKVFLQPREFISMHGTYMGQVDLEISKE